MINPTICPLCFQPNEPARTLCWKCMRSLDILPTPKDYVRIFELPPNWGTNELKGAFLRMAKKYHPDANPGDREADAKFKFVNQAYEILSRVGNQAPAEEEAAAQKAPPPKAEADMGADELYKKLAAVVKESQDKNAKKDTPTSSLRKLARWLRGK